MEKEQRTRSKNRAWILIIIAVLIITCLYSISRITCKSCFLNTSCILKDIPGHLFIPKPELSLSEKPEEESGAYCQQMPSEMLKLRDITVFEGDTAAFFCYAKGAINYEWEYYSSEDKQWNPVSLNSELSCSAEQDAQQRNVSVLKVPGTAENNMMDIRCVISDADGKQLKESACLKVCAIPPEDIKNVQIDAVEAEAGAYIDAESLVLHIDTGEGEKESLEISGLQSMFFCIKQTEDISRTYDEDILTEVRTTTFKELSYVTADEGEQTIPIRLYCADKAYDTEVHITGTDTTPPEIVDVHAEEIETDDSGDKVRIYIEAMDNYSNPSELLYAFSNEEEGEELQWLDKLPVEASVKKGAYNVYVKDKSGNISVRELTIPLNAGTEPTQQEPEITSELEEPEPAAPIILEITEKD